MTMLLDALDLIGRATWEPVWVPTLVWTVFALPLWLGLKQTDRLHPLAEYRLSQVLLATLPVGVYATTLADLLPGSMAAAPTHTLSLTVLPALEAPRAVTSAAVPWHWTQAVGLLTIIAGGAALVRLGRLALDAVAVARVHGSLDDERASSVQAQADQIARTLGVARPFRVCLTPEAAVPFTVSGRRPTVVLPADLAQRPAALRMTLAHECIHVRRYDDLAHLLERLLAALFVAHPLVGQLQQFVVEAREQACDAAVLHDDNNAPADYARLLLAFADGPRPQGLDALSLSESPSSLPNRLRAMRSSVSRWLSSPPSLVATLLAVGLAVTFGIVACSDSISPSPSAPDEPAASSAPKSAKDLQTPPSLKGGLEALQQELQYPKMAEEAGIEGKVLLQVVVDENGMPEVVQVKRSAHRTLDSAAVRAVRSVEFEPGKKNGTPTDAKMVLPVLFRIPDDSSSSRETDEATSSAKIDLEFVFHELSSQEKQEVLSGKAAFQKTTRAALVDRVSYPDLVRKAGIDGTVEVTFTLGESGRPRAPSVTESVHEALDKMALHAVKNTTFTVTEAQTTDLTGQRISVRFAYRHPRSS